MKYWCSYMLSSVGVYWRLDINKESVFEEVRPNRDHISPVCFMKNYFFQTFLCLFVIRKVGQRKTLFSQRKIWLGFQESVFFYFGWKTLYRSCEKFKNIMLFADYINLVLKLLIVIYFVLNFLFSIPSLRIWFNLMFISTLILIFYDCYLLFSYHFLNWIFLSIKFGPHSFYCYLF